MSTSRQLAAFILTLLFLGCGTEESTPDSMAQDASVSSADVSVNTADTDAGPVVDMSLTGSDAATQASDADLTTVDAATTIQDADLAPVDAATPMQDADLTTVDAATPIQDADLTTVDAATPIQDADLTTVDAATPIQDADLTPMDAAIVSDDAEIVAIDAETEPEVDAGVTEPVGALPCEDLLVPASDPEPEYIFTACPAEISVGACRSAMQDILRRSPAAQLCPYQTGAASGDGWCPVRGFAQTCWGYVGTGGDDNTACETGAIEFARAYMRNAQTDEERRSCAVVTAVMSHEGGFAPTAKSWDMFCNGGNTGAIGLFQYDFASGIDPLPAGVDAQFEQFFRGVSGPRFGGLADAWMACNPRIAGATAATMIDYNDVALPACAQAGAPADQREPTELNCRFQGDSAPIGGDSQIRCGADWADANGRCGTPCATSDDCENNETCFAELDVTVCAEVTASSTRCGIDWAYANGRCGTACMTNEECEINEMCFAELDVAVCAEVTVSSTRCGIDWADANGRCGAACMTNEECEINEMCFAQLDTSVCSE